MANFYTLKTKKILAERLALVIDWGAIGCLLEWASLPNLKSGILLVMIRDFWQWLQRGSVNFGSDLGYGLCFCGLGTRPHTCGLGPGSAFSSLLINGPNLWPFNTLLMSNFLPITVLGHWDLGDWGKGKISFRLLQAGQGHCGSWDPMPNLCQGAFTEGDESLKDDKVAGSSIVCVLTG